MKAFRALRVSLQIASSLLAGGLGTGSVRITDGGLVSVGDTLSMHGFINIATGGTLALDGEADGSITGFLDRVEGSGAIRYWDTSLPGWAHLTAATEGVDYTLDYHTSGDLEGFTVLTVFTPILEPTAVVMLGFAATLFAASRRCRNQRRCTSPRSDAASVKSQRMDQPS